MQKSKLKLKLKSETIRTLTPDELRYANGGGSVVACYSLGCSAGCTAGPGCPGTTIQ